MVLRESTSGDDVRRTVTLPPDESITDAIGRGHTLATAVADIIDNSVDARAENVRIRFVTDDDRLLAVRIRDDGEGMTPARLQDAMTLGKQREREDGALGHFGIGLKAASLSQALTLTVYSQHSSADPCAMRIHRGSFTGEVLDDIAARNGYDWDDRGPASTGTVVEWRDLETINQSQLRAERRSWLERTVTSLMQTLGLTFHRLIQERGVRIAIDTWDARLGAPGFPRTVEPRDPFQFNLSGDAHYPTTISATTSDGARLDAECFILPPRSDSPSAWLLGRNPVEWQGIYVYRNDRLLQAGGWLDVRQDDKRLRLARMRINLTKPLERHLRLRHEKSGVTATPEFTAALEAATNASGVTLDRFRDDALETYRISNVKKQAIKPAAPVESGLPDRVVEAVRDELGERDEEPIGIEWRMLPEDRLFEMHHDRRVLRFNLGYRSALGGENSAIIPTLVYLLLESNFTKSRLNQVTKDQIDAWQSIASAALLAQLSEDAYDPLANWPKPEAVSADTEARPNIMAGPRPAPPSIELRWAHLGHRGQVPPEPAEELDDSAGWEMEPAELVALASSADRWDDGATGLLQVSEPSSPPEGPVAEVDISEHERTSGELAASQQGNVNATQAARERLPPLDVHPGDREIVAMYRGHTDIDAIATTLDMEQRDVAMRLCALVLDLEGDDIDDQALAAMHGMPYTPDDRERILEMYRDRRTVRAIAAHFNRTPFAIAWQLLSSPKRPVEVPRNLIKRIDRALPRAACTPSPDALERRSRPLTLEG